MSFTRIKDRLSNIVSQQLPEFIQADYPTFVAFIEAYYRFLEQDQSAFELLQNARSYADIDTTVPSFVQYFIKNYASDLPESTLANKYLLIKRIKDLYESKGSETSFKLLFRILFNENVSVRYPYENVLRASAGKWQQRLSLRVETVSGDRSLLVDKRIKYFYQGVMYETPIIETKVLTSTLTEIFLNPNFAAPAYNLGDTIEIFNGTSITFTGIIRPTTVGYRIDRAGTGFKLGQIFSINFAGGIGTLVKITELTESKGIRKLQFVNYGYNYSAENNTFSVEIDPSKTVSEISNIFTTRTQGFGSTGLIEAQIAYDPNSPDRYFFSDYVVTDYTAISSFRSFDDSTFSAPVSFASAKPIPIATISFTLGSLGRYPGSFFTNDSFLSEADVRLEDDQLYQPFAYQTITELDIEEFFGFVKNLIHPAGEKLFNNRVIFSDIDLSANVLMSPQSNVYFEARSNFRVEDEAGKALYRTIAASNNAVQMTDDFDMIRIKPVVDSLNTPTDFDTLNLNKVVVSDATMTDDVNIAVTNGIFVFEIQNIAEQLSSFFNKPINNTDATVEITDNGGVGIAGLNDPNKYFEEVYHEGIYTEPTTIRTF